MISTEILSFGSWYFILTIKVAELRSYNKPLNSHTNIRVVPYEHSKNDFEKLVIRSYFLTISKFVCSKLYNLFTNLFFKLRFSSCLYLVRRMSGVNFTDILCSAFACLGPQSSKNTDYCKLVETFHVVSECKTAVYFS